MDIKEKHYNQIQKNGHRLTRHRVAIIEILEQGKLTFKDLQNKLSSRNLINIASIYNNLDFLISENIVIELRLGNKTYYDLTRFNKQKDSTHIYVLNKQTNDILEINNKDLINLKQIDRDECIELFEEYKKQGKTIY